MTTSSYQLNLTLIVTAFLLALCSTLFIAELPSMIVVYPFVMLVVVSYFFTSNIIIKLLYIAILGFAYMDFHVQQHLSKSFPESLEAQKVEIIGTISSIIESKDNSKAKFLFKIGHNKVQLSWSAAPPNLRPGDKWRLQVKLRRARNYANPGSFDSEKFNFYNRISAAGYVLNNAEQVFIDNNCYSYNIAKLRQKILAFIKRVLTAQRFRGVIVALVLGTKSLMPHTQWDLFQNTGIAHLMSISGLHIGLIASLCFSSIKLCWRFVPYRWLRVAAPLVAAIAALIASVFYALLAGCTIATQRALIMLVVFLSGILLKRKISSAQSYSLALVFVLLWDPFAILCIGFWLSFVAVGLLLYALNGRKHKRWLQPQIVMAIGLLPLTLLVFGRNSIIAPLANIIVIPWVSFAVVPMALLAVVIMPLSESISKIFLLVSEYNFGLLWPVLEYFNKIPVYSWRKADQCFSLVCAMFAVLWLFIPKGLPGRYWACLGFMPLFFARPSILPPGQAEFTLLDVGQGLAAVVRTQNHVLVYDTGAKLNDGFDLGSMVVAPYLQTMGLKKIDTLMISHADNDHIGGAVSLMSKLNTKELLINDIAELYTYNPKLCSADRQWEWDGVTFKVLHPGYETISSKRNDHSCVLMVQAGKHKLLLTGDIESKSEKHLVATYGSYLQADLLVVPHHGSKTSSSIEFIKQVQPKYALIPVGYKNQYRHPAPQIMQRYQELQIPSLRTDLDGALSFVLGGHDLKPKLYRVEQRHFWLAKGG